MIIKSCFCIICNSQSNVYLVMIVDTPFTLLLFYKLINYRVLASNTCIIYMKDKSITSENRVTSVSHYRRDSLQYFTLK